VPVGQTAGTGTSGTASSGTGSNAAVPTGAGVGGTSSFVASGWGGSRVGGGGVGTATTGTQCTDGIDNDGDGLVDGFDPECTGAGDDDEASFATGMPGDNRDPKWQDCFFDGNSGAGDDGCRYATGCLLGELPLTDPDCVVTQQCLDFCRPMTSNGCDCFGCCTVQLPSGSTVDVMEVATCSVSRVSDATACPRCTKSSQCNNDCGQCELCLGKTQADLPASCTPTGTGGTGGGGRNAGGDPPSYTCNNGAQVCGPGLTPCPVNQYCSLGCCIYSQVF
jgi:hypothetical protein